MYFQQPALETIAWEEYGVKDLIFDGLMAPIGEVYFPPLDRCFSGEHQLLYDSKPTQEDDTNRAQVMEDYLRSFISV